MTDDDIHRLKSEFDSLLESSYDGIILADADSILNVNASFGRITGVAPSLLKNKKFNELDTAKHICLEPVQICRIGAFLHHSMTGQAEEHHSALSEFSDVQFSGCLSSAP